MMKIINIYDLCNPKQWKTISGKNILESGKYPVYGANGIIGYYNEFNHEDETLLITCRGATCGQLNISVPYSYVNGNAMALNDLSGDVHLKYLYYYLQERGFSDIISGSAQPQITKTGLKKLKIPLPDLPTQKAIAAQLDQAEAIKTTNQQLLAKYDELAQAIFLEMFGDPVMNERGWEVKRLEEFGEIITGNTPSSKNRDYYNSKDIEWIKTNNIIEDKIIVTQAQNYLSAEGAKVGRIVNKNALLVTCIAGSVSSIGRSALTNRKVAFNQQINALVPNGKVSPLYIYYLFKLSKNFIQDNATSGMKRIITKGIFKELEMILPPLNLQTEFARRIENIERQKALLRQEIEKTEELFNSLLQESFRFEEANTPVASDHPS